MLRVLERDAELTFSLCGQAQGKRVCGYQRKIWSGGRFCTGIISEDKDTGVRGLRMGVCVRIGGYGLLLYLLAH